MAQNVHLDMGEGRGLQPFGVHARIALRCTSVHLSKLHKLGKSIFRHRARLEK
jgi:hypothetical protein